MTFGAIDLATAWALDALIGDPAWIPCCEWVIDRAIAGEDLDVIAPVPEGYKVQSARGVLEGLHLEPWVGLAAE